MDAHRHPPDIFYIRIAGQLDDHWSEWMEGMEPVHLDDGSSLLTGALSDQSALIGVLLKIHHLGLKLISVHSTSGGKNG